MKVKLLKPLKTSKRLMPRGEVVDLPKEQAESYLDRNLAVKPNVDLEDELPPTANAPEPESPAADDEHADDEQVEKPGGDAGDDTADESTDSGEGEASDQLLDEGGTALPPWEFKLTPIEYVDRQPADAPNTELANKYIRAGHGKYKAKQEEE